MYRIDTSDAATTKPTRAAAGPKPNGHFTSSATDGTTVTDDWAEAVQEEIAGVVEGAGITLSKADDTQLLEALQALIGNTTNPFINYALFQDEKASGVDGDPYPTANVWQKRTLIEKENNIAGCSIAGSVITLPAGTYRVKGWCQAERTVNGEHQSRAGVFETDSGLTANLLIAGSAEAQYADARPGQTANSKINGKFTTLGTTITIRDVVSYANSDLGRPWNEAGVSELYASIEVWKIA